MLEISLNVSAREISTKGTLNQKRKGGSVPGIYYAKGQEPVRFFVPVNSINPLVFTSETHIVNLVVDGKEPLRCILKNVQFDPVTDKVIHIDFQGITVGQVIQLQVPVMLKGNAAGVREGGLLQHYLHKLDIECLPRHIPQHIDIDVTDLHIGDAVHVRDLSLENIKILNAPDASITAVTHIRGTETPEASAEEQISEPEVIAKGKSAEEED